MGKQKELEVFPDGPLITGEKEPAKCLWLRLHGDIKEFKTNGVLGMSLTVGEHLLLKRR